MKVNVTKGHTLLLASAMLLSSAANAAVEATVGAANMYLYRGQNLTPNSAQVHGGISVSGESGLYGGVWTSAADGGSETDLYVGFGGEAGVFTYDLSYWEYMYPEARDEDNKVMGISDSDLSEYAMSLGVAGFTVSAYFNADSDNDDDSYYSLDYSFDRYSITYGMMDLEHPDASDADEYSHLTVTYSATDELKFGVSKAFSDRDDDLGVEEDPLVFVAYDLALELSK